MFDSSKSAAGNYGGITILTDSAHGLNTGYTSWNWNNVAGNQNLFYVAYNGVTSLNPSSGGAWSFDTLGRINAHVQQTCILSALPFTIDYNIQGSGKMFIKVTVTNTGAAISGQTLQFDIQRRAAAATTVSVGNSAANTCPWFLVSCDSARHIDPLLVPFTLWNTAYGAATGATAFDTSASNGRAGYKSTSWGIGAGQRQTWEFMLDFSHRCWNDSNGIGAYAGPYRNPDSLHFIAGCPIFEQAWEEHLNGHWKLDETTGDSAYDNSGSLSHGVRTPPGSGTWTTGRLGGGLLLTGSQNVTVANSAPNSAGLSGTQAGAMTVMAWIKPAGAISSGTTIISKISGSTGYKFSGAAGGVLAFQADGNAISAATAVGAGAWHHAAAVCNRVTDTVKIYLDGRLDENLDRRPHDHRELLQHTDRRRVQRHHRRRPLL